MGVAEGLIDDRDFATAGTCRQLAERGGKLGAQRSPSRRENDQQLIEFHELAVLRENVFHHAIDARLDRGAMRRGLDDADRVVGAHALSGLDERRFARRRRAEESAGIRCTQRRFF